MFEAAVDDRGPAALEERPAAPEHDRRRERELEPGAPAARDAALPMPEHVAHRQSTSGSQQRGADPEAAAHVAGVGARPSSSAAPSSARAPCRRSGSRPARPARSPGASGGGRQGAGGRGGLGLRVFQGCRGPRYLSGGGETEKWGVWPDAHADAGRSSGRRSCRTPGSFTSLVSRLLDSVTSGGCRHRSAPFASTGPTLDGHSRHWNLKSGRTGRAKKSRRRPTTAKPEAWPDAVDLVGVSRRGRRISASWRRPS